MSIGSVLHLFWLTFYDGFSKSILGSLSQNCKEQKEISGKNYQSYKEIQQDIKQSELRIFRTFKCEFNSRIRISRLKKGCHKIVQIRLTMKVLRLKKKKMTKN